MSGRGSGLLACRSVQLLIKTYDTMYAATGQSMVPLASITASEGTHLHAHAAT